MLSVMYGVMAMTPTTFAIARLRARYHVTDHNSTDRKDQKDDSINQKLFVLEASGDGRLFSINPDGSDKTVLVTGCPVPDGVAVDVEAGHIYWTNMGSRRSTTARSNGWTSTEATGPRSSPAEAPTPPSNFTRHRRVASCTGATAKACG